MKITEIKYEVRINVPWKHVSLVYEKAKLCDAKNVHVYSFQTDMSRCDIEFTFNNTPSGELFERYMVEFDLCS